MINTGKKGSDETAQNCDDSEENTPAIANTHKPTEGLTDKHATSNHNGGNYGCHGTQMTGKYIAQNRNKYRQARNDESSGNTSPHKEDSIG